MAPPETPVDVDPMFSFLDWRYGDEVDPKLSEYVRSSYPEESSGAVVASAVLSFYDTFRLLKIIFPPNTRTSSGVKLRGYALYRIDDGNSRKQLKIVALDGTSLPIHETNKSDLILSESTADDYLRFFCSAVHGEEGPFLILDEENYTYLANLEDNESVRDKLKEESLLGIQSEANPALREEFVRLSNPFPGSSLQRRKACVIYSSILFRAWFAIDNSAKSRGMVEMVNDEPILATLNAKVPKYGDRSLVVLHRVSGDDHALPLERSPDGVEYMVSSTQPAKTRTAAVAPSTRDEHHSFSRSKPDHYYGRRGRSADECAEIEKLLATLTGSETPLDDPIEVELLFCDGQYQETGTTELLVRNRRFKRPVRIEDWGDSRPLVFDNCLFGGGFSAQGAKIARGLSFIGCTFELLGTCAGCSDVALDLSNARIYGDIVLFDCIVRGRLFAQGLRAKNNVRLQGCGIVPANWQVGGAIKASEIRDKGVEDHLTGFKPNDGAKDQDTNLVVFDSAAVGGHLEIFSAGKETSRRVNAAESRSDQDDGGASVIAGRVSCERIEVNGNVTFSELIVFRPISVNASKVTGNFTLRRALLLLRSGEKPSDDRLRLNRIEVARKLEINDAEIRGAVSLHGVTVGGACDLTGLHCAGDLNLAFSTIGHLRAYRTVTDSLADQESLNVGRNLILSAATVGVLELRGATIQRNLIAQTGVFGVFTLSFGVKPWTDDAKVRFFWPKPCNVGAISLTSIHVRETFDAGGIKVSSSYDPTKDNRQDFELLNSKIDGALVFFAPDKLDKRLQVIWDDTITTPTWRPDPSEPSVCGYPSESCFPSEIKGNLLIRACRIGGDLDLRNVRLRSDDRGIVLTSTAVGLDLKAGLESQPSSNDGLMTQCRCLNGEKLSCQGDVDLSGIRVGTEVASGTKIQSTSRDQTSNESEPAAAQPDGSQHLASISQVTTSEAGDISLQGAHIAGDLLIARTRRKENSSFSEVTGLATILRTLNLTAVHCEKLVLSGKSFDLPRNAKSEARVILARGHFSQVEIHEWNNQPIDLQQITVDKWILMPKKADDRESAHEYVNVLKAMDPEDRSTWIRVEADLRNKSYEWQADRVYLAMVWSSMRRRRQRWKQWWILLRPFVFLWHFLVCLAQTCFLWFKAFFIVPLAFTVMTLTGLSCLFTEPCNVRATVGYLHALPMETRMATLDPNEIHPDEPKLGSESKWDAWDAIALAVRYHVPLFENRTHDRWEASGSEAEFRDSRLGMRMETIAFWVEIIYWVMLPILLLGFAAWAFRKRETE